MVSDDGFSIHEVCCPPHLMTVGFWGMARLHLCGLLSVTALDFPIAECFANLAKF